MDEELEQPEQTLEQVEEINQSNSVDKISLQPIVWQAEEFETHRRNWIWYLVTICAIVLVLIYTFYVRQWILTAVVVVIGLILYLSNRIKPRNMQYRIDGQGLHVNDKIFSFDQLKSYWFFDKDGKSYLNVISTFRFLPVITAQINPDLKDEIRAMLGAYVPESNRKDEDLVDKINRFLKV